ncbi:alpha/beta fold hydrolase [Actinomadura sp. 9N215]|uniref:alpha/beta fold hydrolase n=1 Tax=Actinomadura sp. 9N215 TaxID=3375150 RepID=UPI0037A2FA51
MAFDRRQFMKISGAAGLATGVSAAGLATGVGPASAAAGTSRTTAVTHRIVRTNGIDMHVAEAGRGPAVLLLHGFPELWYSWRHQLPALAAAGFRALAPDLRGYGRTDAPAEVRGYTLRSNLADLTGLLDALGVRTAALVGHDQGAGIAWAGAQFHPDRFPAMVALGVAYSPRLPMPLTEYLRRNNPGKFNVVLYFQPPGVAEAELDADPARTLRMTLYALSGQAPLDLVPRWLLNTPEGAGFLDPLPDPGRPSRWCRWVSDAEFGRFAREFRRTGFGGALRRYRALDLDWSDLPQEGTLKVHQPTLYLTGELDSAYRLGGSLDPMREMVPGLRRIHVMPGCGHWTQQERPHEVNRHLIDFLRREYTRPRSQRRRR